MADVRSILFLSDINSIHTQRWVNSLMANGFKIGLYSLSAKTSSWTDDLDGLTYKCFGIKQDVVRSQKKLGKLRYFAAQNELRSFCNEFSPDIVHAHYASSYGMLAARLKFPKTILSLWGSDVYEFPKRSILHRIIFKKILRLIPVICSTSNNMAIEAAKYVSKNYHITPFGVNTELFKPTERVEQILTIGTVKALEKVYGIDRLIQLFAKFLENYKNPARLLIYGKGAELEELKSLVVELNLEKSVQFKGFVEGDELVKAFNSLDIFVALSRQESFGVAVIEAQACGVPVIVSNVGGLPEVVGREAGFVIGGDDIEMGVSTLMKMSEKNKRNKMSVEARSFVEKNFSEKVCVEKLIQVYDQL
jgi:glycosyltransferase involved in cell wall biosynthesis